MTELNTLYYNSVSGTCYNGQNNASINCDFTSKGLGITASNMIDNAIYHLGGYSGSSIYADDFYNYERGTIIYDCSDGDDGACPRTTTWTGKIGIMYPSDYAYATDLSLCKLPGNEYDNSVCKNNDWLLYSSGQWTITPNSSLAESAFYMLTSGYVFLNYPCASDAIRSVLYLKSDIIIKGGTGTSSDHTL